MRGSLSASQRRESSCVDQITCSTSAGAPRWTWRVPLTARVPASHAARNRSPRRSRAPREFPAVRCWRHRLHLGDLGAAGGRGRSPHCARCAGGRVRDGSCCGSLRIARVTEPTEESCGVGDGDEGAGVHERGNAEGEDRPRARARRTAHDLRCPEQRGITWDNRPTAPLPRTAASDAGTRRARSPLRIRERRQPDAPLPIDVRGIGGEGAGGAERLSHVAPRKSAGDERAHEVRTFALGDELHEGVGRRWRSARSPAAGGRARARDRSARSPGAAGPSLSRSPAPRRWCSRRFRGW